MIYYLFRKKPKFMFKEDGFLERRADDERDTNWEKSNLTVEEAAAYSGIGMNKLRDLSDKETCPFVLWVGTKRLIKRRKLDEYIEKAYSI